MEPLMLHRAPVGTSSEGGSSVTGRRRNLGLAGGSLWLIVSGAGFAGASLLVVQTALATTLLTTMGVLAAGLIVFGIATIHAAFQLPDEVASRKSEGRRIARQFGVIVGIEGLTLTLVTVVCVVQRRWGLIAPLDLMIVGLHFLPLARLFTVARYYLTAALFCAIPIATMLLIPESGRIGHALSWLVLPSVGCAFVAWVTGVAGLLEVRQLVGAFHTPLAFVVPRV